MTGMAALAVAPPRPALEVIAPRRPPLENGDHLTREEFERRWDAHPEIKRAELIDGVVFLDVSVGIEHGEHHGDAAGWAAAFAAFHRATVQLLLEPTVRLPAGQDVQPDVCLRLRSGGSSRRADDRDLVEGAPEFAFEVAASSASRDLHRKRDLYLEAGVQEYAVWQLFEGRVDWWRAVDGEWVAIEPDADGVIESLFFPGLRLDVPKLLAGDMAGVLAALR